MKYQDIFQNNSDWVKSKLDLDPNYFANLSKGQSPEFLYIWCSDSRVSAENLMGLEPGDVFVHRNIANMVPNADQNVHSVIEYAVTHLKVNHVVVCGHYYCGGIKAAMDSADLGTLNPWLRNIRDVFRMHQDTLDAIKDEDEKYKKLIELNVQEQCVNVLKTTCVQKAMAERGLQVHGWVFDIGTGKIIDLGFDMKSITYKFSDLYKIDF
jgi:carbonic anhydrase